MIHHVCVDVSDLERSGRFYDAVLGALGWRRQLDTTSVIAWGIVSPVFFASRRSHRRAAGRARLLLGQRHLRRSRRLGGRRAAPAAPTTGAPGPRPEYGASYYSAYLLDPDGHRVEIAVQSN